MAPFLRVHFFLRRQQLACWERAAGRASLERSPQAAVRSEDFRGPELARGPGFGDPRSRLSVRSSNCSRKVARVHGMHSYQKRRFLEDMYDTWLALTTDQPPLCFQASLAEKNEFYDAKCLLQKVRAQEHGIRNNGC